MSLNLGRLTLYLILGALACSCVSQDGQLQFEGQGNGCPPPGGPIICDSGSLNGPCTISSVQTLPAGAFVNVSGTLTITSTGSIKTAAGQSAQIAVCGDLDVQGAGTISGNFTLQANNLTISSGGSINADGMGYAGGISGAVGSGSGGGASATGSGAGGGHGGPGGNSGSGAVGGSTYDNPSDPSLWGSGGGGVSGGSGYGGNGGGSLFITVFHSTQIDGTLSANGYGGNTGGGGGAGGTILLTTESLSGAGSMTAEGGGGSTNGSFGGGGGGGGLIKHSVSGSNTFTGSEIVAGGAGGMATNSGVAGGNGSAL